jgi:hypothetical protein
MRMRVWVALLLVVVLPGAASAQTACPRGQSVTDDTAGHCCWTAQRWSEAAASCVGYPLCPADLRAQNEQCVPLSAPAPAPTRFVDPYETRPPPLRAAPPRLVAPPSKLVTETRPGLGGKGYLVGSLLLALGAADLGLGLYLAAGTDGAYHEVAGSVCIVTGLAGAITGIVVLALAPKSRVLVERAAVLRWSF